MRFCSFLLDAKFLTISNRIFKAALGANRIITSYIYALNRICILFASDTNHTFTVQVISGLVTVGEQCRLILLPINKTCSIVYEVALLGRGEINVLSNKEVWTVNNWSDSDIKTSICRLDRSRYWLKLAIISHKLVNFHVFEEDSTRII